MLMLESGAVVVAAVEASVADVPIVDPGMIGAIVATTVAGAGVTVGAVVVRIGVVSGNWEVDSPCLACNYFSNYCSI